MRAFLQKRLETRLVRGLVLLFFGSMATAAGAQGLRIYISADMEGVAGAVSGEQLGKGGMEYQRFREFMTAEVNAAIEGARAAGATDFTVSDSHGSKQNLLIEKLPDDVRIIRGGPRPLSMMQGIDESFDAVMFIGYHAGASHPTGVQAHTMSGGTVFAIEINGTPVTEGMINAAIAGRFGVPVILISGDDAAIEEVTAVVGEMEEAVVKWAINARSSETLTPRAAQALIREKARQAVSRIEEFRAFTITSPLVLDLTFRQAVRAELFELLPIVERTSRRAIRYRAEDVLEIQRFLKFALSYPGS